MRLPEYSNVKFILLFCFLLFIDQFSKIIYQKYITDSYVLNDGIAFSIQIPIFFVILLSLSVLALIIFMIKKEKLEKNIIWLFFLAGGFGNLIDRIFIGGVVDFIRIGNFPIFNIADVYLTLSALGIIYYYFINQSEDGKSRN